MCVPGTLRGQKKAADPLALEVQMVLSHQMGAGKSNWGPQEKQILSTAEQSVCLASCHVFPQMLLSL